MKVIVIAAIAVATMSCSGPSDAERDIRKQQELLEKEEAEAIEATEKALLSTAEKMKAQREEAEAALLDASTSDAGKQEARETLEAIEKVEEATAEVKKALEDR